LADRPRWKRSLIIALAVAAGFVVYAYGFGVTQVNLDQIRSEQRRESLYRILRALAQPELVEYETADTAVDAPILVPCPEGGVDAPEPEQEPYVVVEPPCTDPRTDVAVRGVGFADEVPVTIYFVPSSEVQLRVAQVTTDREGAFETTIRVPNRPDAEPQTVRAIARAPVGAPQLTRTAYDTWYRIVETVFLALIGTTVGTILAVPMSFLAARNLMRDISTPLLNLSMALVALPLGVVAGALLARWAGAAAAVMVNSAAVTVAGVVLLPLAIAQGVRWTFPSADSDAERSRSVRTVSLIVLGVVGTLLLYLGAETMQDVGSWAARWLGPFAFLASFLVTLGEILTLAAVPLAALLGGGVAAGLANRLAHAIRAVLPYTTVRALATPLAAVAGALIAVGIARAIGWFYEWNDPSRLTYVPAAVGAAVGLALAARAWKRESIKIGLTIYYIARTVFNALRSIEPLVMAIVFVVWVGLGPFAGSLALALHTVAALAKLYSEQVESIMPGPMEAVRATGATRLQTIVYAVVPQIVSPYISFTMYRWDINVRMSTIIGFVGGGGIGFLLQQNINLLNYRAAAAQMLAIAIVVASMDYLSSRIRERFV
jgi:phosphonate ABC transporter permease subunit PhnE